MDLSFLLSVFLVFGLISSLAISACVIILVICAYRLLLTKSNINDKL